MKKRYFAMGIKKKLMAKSQVVKKLVPQNMINLEFVGRFRKSCFGESRGEKNEINQQWRKLCHNWSIRAASPMRKTNFLDFGNKKSASIKKLSNDTLKRKRMK